MVDPFTDFTVIRQLGKGRYGNVFLVETIPSSKKICCKFATTGHDIVTQKESLIMNLLEQYHLPTFVRLVNTRKVCEFSRLRQNTALQPFLYFTLLFEEYIEGFSIQHLTFLPSISVILEVIYSLKFVNDEIGFCHHDLHVGNIICRPTMEKSIRIGNYSIATNGIIPVIFDYGLSSCRFVEGIPFHHYPSRSYVFDVFVFLLSGAATKGGMFTEFFIYEFYPLVRSIRKLHEWIDAFSNEYMRMLIWKDWNRTLQTFQPIQGNIELWLDSIQQQEPEYLKEASRYFYDVILWTSFIVTELAS